MGGGTGGKRGLAHAGDRAVDGSKSHAGIAGWAYSVAERPTQTARMLALFSVAGRAFPIVHC